MMSGLRKTPRCKACDLPRNEEQLEILHSYWRWAKPGK